MLQPLHIPKCCRQARSRKAHPPPRQGSSVQFSKCKEESSSTTAVSIDQGSDDLVSRHKEETPEWSLVRCSMPWNDKHKGIVLKSLEVPAIDAESVTKNASLSSSNNGIKGLQLCDPVSNHSTIGSLRSIPDKSMLPAGGSVDAWLAPGNVVWAKTAHHKWWPAEVMDERSVLQCSNDKYIGHVLVQLYGNHEYAWLDPVDLSQFDYCYGERSKNHSKAFQEALKQALCKHSRTSPRKLSDGFSGELKISVQHEQPSGKAPSLSSTKGVCNVEGRGKRKRRLKIHFDELSIPENLDKRRRMRRLRIMRYLGLAAPAGSPYSLPHGRTAS